MSLPNFYFCVILCWDMGYPYWLIKLFYHINIVLPCLVMYDADLDTDFMTYAHTDPCLVRFSNLDDNSSLGFVYFLHKSNLF